MQRSTHIKALSMPTRWPVLINSGLQRTLLRQTQSALQPAVY
jgi:hypothetical protein